MLIYPYDIIVLKLIYSYVTVLYIVIYFYFIIVLKLIYSYVTVQ